MSQYVYIKSSPDCYTVGFYAPNGSWEPETDHPTSEEAARRVHWLNGGGNHDKQPERSGKDL